MRKKALGLPTYYYRNKKERIDMVSRTRLALALGYAVLSLTCSKDGSPQAPGAPSSAPVKQYVTVRFTLAVLNAPGHTTQAEDFPFRVEGATVIQRDAFQGPGGGIMGMLLSVEAGKQYSITLTRRAPGYLEKTAGTCAGSAPTDPNALTLACHVAEVDTSFTCDRKLWEQVYSAEDRLTELGGCKAAVGPAGAQDVNNEDGDGNVDAYVIPAFYDYLIAGNTMTDARGRPRKFLQVERMCQGVPTSAEAVSQNTCKTFDLRKRVAQPVTGRWYVYVGPYVKDGRHGWNEFHGADWYEFADVPEWFVDMYLM